MSRYLRAFVLALAGSTLVASASTSTSNSNSWCQTSWSTDTCQLFTESMEYLDRIYDASAGYVYDPSAATALRHDTRTSVWYAVGLLARDQGDDVAQAMTIIRNVIDAQFKDTSDQWWVVDTIGEDIPPL